jgi:hypothetical protein
MASVVAFPRLPTPPGDINSAYIADLVRALEFFIALVANPGEGRATTQVLTNIQEGNDVGLEPGTLYTTNCINTNSEGYVRISLLNVSASAGSTGTGEIGTVTVAVS